MKRNIVTYIKEYGIDMPEINNFDFAEEMKKAI